MPFGLPPVKTISSLLALSALLCAGSGSPATAQEDARIGAHVVLDDQWAQLASEENRAFVQVLRAQTGTGSIDTLPNDRLYHLYRTKKLDCILTGGWPPNDPQLRSQQTLVFEIRLFILSNTDLLAKDQILVGRMKQFAPPAIPLENTMVDWLPLQNLQQGFDLLRAKRIDALLAAPSHVQYTPDSNSDTRDIVQANLPAIKRIEVPLLCHDTVANRGIIERVDQAAPSQ
ncbi:hypothetical protein ACQ0MK_10370 [Thalassospira lucentensis]|uniref:hypothetical protein n=1 Tax=Thalassospira lucentensis TaxID=168935 RepID=UPI003D2F12F8